MEAIKLKARIGADATFEWIEPLPDLPPGEIEIIVLYEHRQDIPISEYPARQQHATTTTSEAMDNIQDDTLEDDSEWMALTPDERAGHARRNLTPDEIAARLQWIDDHAGCIHLPDDQAMEIAMDDWIAEENLDL